MDIYVARPGDSAGAIAKRLKVSEKELRQINSLGTAGTVPANTALLMPRGDACPRHFLEYGAELSPDVPPEEAGSFSKYLSFACPGFCTLSTEGEPLFPAENEKPSLIAIQGALPLLGLKNLCPAGVFSPECAHRVIAGKKARVSAASLTADKALSLGYKGIYLEFCAVFPFDLYNYLAFLSLLSDACHERGLYLFAALAPFEFSGLSDREEYLTLCSHSAKCADKVVLLCYDWADILSPPGPLSPVSRTREAVNFLSGTVPFKKLIPAFAMHGFDWTLPWRLGDRAVPVSPVTARSLAAGAGIKYDSGSGCCHFTYTDSSGRRHGVFYEDVRAVSLRLRLCEEYSLAGLFLKRPEFADRQLLMGLSGHLGVKKYI